jgi:Tol biopolymer transport system component
MPRSAFEFARRTLIIGTFAIAGVLNACSSDASSPVAPEASASSAKGGGGKPGSAESVLFVGSAFDRAPNIYSMNPDGSNVRRLTTDSIFLEAEPDFAAGNRKFVFVRSNGGGSIFSELWTANADGSKQTQLTSLGTRVFQPRYSPDGSKIAFVADVELDNEIFVINADGTGLLRITYAPGDDNSPTWTPDGSRIAFESRRGGSQAIYSMTAGGLDVKPIIDCAGFGCRQPAYSPDGTMIAAASSDAGNIIVFDMGDNVVLRVGPSMIGSSSSHPTWTKDGTRVLFHSDRGIEGTRELYVGTPGDLTPTSVKRLTLFSPGEAVSPSYSH